MQHPMKKFSLSWCFGSHMLSRYLSPSKCILSSHIHIYVYVYEYIYICKYIYIFSLFSNISFLSFPTCSQRVSSYLITLHFLLSITCMLLFRNKSHKSLGKPCCSQPSHVGTLLQPYGLQPARLLCPWYFPSKNTGVGCHSYSRGSS